MADNSGFIKIGLIGAAAYLAYKQGWLSMLGIGAPAAAVVAPVPVVVPNPNTITGSNSLDSIYTRIATASGLPAAGLTVDTWGWYLNNELAAVGKVAPDPMGPFTAAVPNFDRAQLITGPQYWAVMAPALKLQLGLSGLGFYGGLGAVARWVS